MFAKNWAFVTACMLSLSGFANQHYVMPPTSSTRGSVPIISDSQMEQCVEIYNQAKWLSDSLQNFYVDNIQVSL